MRKVHFSRMLASAAAAVGACSPALLGAGAIAQGTTSLQSISASDKAQGAQANPQLVAEYGGAVIGPQANYVAVSLTRHRAAAGKLKRAG